MKLEPLHPETVDIQKRNALRDELLDLQNKQGIRLAHIHNNWVKVVTFEGSNAVQLFYRPVMSASLKSQGCFGQARFSLVHVSASGTRFVGLTDYGLAIVSLEGSEEWSKHIGENVTAVALAPAGAKIAFRTLRGLFITRSGADEPVRLAENEAAASTGQGSQDAPSTMDWSPDSQEFVYSRAGEVRIYDLASGRSRAVGRGSRPNLVTGWAMDRV